MRIRFAATWFASLALTLSAAPASAVEIAFTFDFLNDIYDGSGTITFDNDPGAGGPFTENLANLTNLSIAWNIPNTAGFDENDLVQQAIETLLVANGASPNRTFLFDHTTPAVNAEFLNNNGDLLTFITDATNDILLDPAGLAPPTTGTFTATEVPEPGSALLTALGLLALGASRRPRG